jgi:hypothetical protein
VVDFHAFFEGRVVDAVVFGHDWSSCSILVNDRSW